MKRSVVIIGAGISGLTAAYRLNRIKVQSGIDLNITVVEKSDYIGGTIRTEHVNGFVIEAGPDCFFVEKPYAGMLVKELGLSDRLIGTNNENQGTFVLWNNKLHRLPEGVILMIPTKFMPFVTSSLFSFFGKIRMGMELFVPRRTDGVDESLSEFTIRRFGKEALDRIAEPLVAGVHAGDPDTMSVKSSFPRFVDMEQKYGSLIRGMIKARAAMRATTGGHSNSMFMTMKDGLKELTDALKKNSPDVDFKMGVKALSIQRKKNNDEPPYYITLSNGELLVADGIILATPAYVSAELVSPINKDLSELLLSIPYVSTATISLAYKKENFNHRLKGFGFVVPKKENRHIMAATWTSSKFSYRAPDDAVLIRCFIGGAWNQKIVFESDETIIDIIKTELGEIMGISSEPIFTRIYRWEKAMPQYTIGHGSRIKTIEQLLGGIGNIQVCGSAYNGIGISDCINSGNLAAQNLLKGLLK
ncbi:MAG: protoporphyrinogen oxidase [bacterium]